MRITTLNDGAEPISALIICSANRYDGTDNAFLACGIGNSSANRVLLLSKSVNGAGNQQSQNDDYFTQHEHRMYKLQNCYRGKRILIALGPQQNSVSKTDKSGMNPCRSSKT